MVSYTTRSTRFSCRCTWDFWVSWMQVRWSSTYIKIDRETNLVNPAPWIFFGIFCRPFLSLLATKSDEYVCRQFDKGWALTVSSVSEDSATNKTVILSIQIYYHGPYATGEARWEETQSSHRPVYHHARLLWRCYRAILVYESHMRGPQESKQSPSFWILRINSYQAHQYHVLESIISLGFTQLKRVVICVGLMQIMHLADRRVQRAWILPGRTTCETDIAGDQCSEGSQVW